MRFFIILSFFFLCSCQSYKKLNSSLNNWIDSWKDYSFTQMASQGTQTSVSKEDRSSLLLLFLDIEELEGSCNGMTALVEDNPALQDIESSYGFAQGWLFDALDGFSYERALFNSNPYDGELEAQGFLVANVWKSKYTLKRINQVVADMAECYPY